MKSNMTDAYIFEESLNKGEEGDKKVKSLFANFYFPIANRFLEFEGYKYGLNKKYTEKQRAGQDGKISASFCYDTKLRSYYKDKIILLEIWHIYLNYPKNSLGWFFTSEADVIFYLYRAKSKIKFFDSGYYLFLNNLRNWLIPRKNVVDRFPIKKNNKPSIDNRGIQWDTYNLYIEPKHIPADCILKIEKNAFVTPIEKSYFNKFFEGD